MKLDRIRRLLDEGSLDEAIKELRLLEKSANVDDTESVLISASRQRMLQRRRSNVTLSSDRLVTEEEQLVAQVRSRAELLEMELNHDQNYDVTDKRPSRAVQSHELSRASIKTTNVLLLIHGIRTRAPWFEIVDHVMSRQVPCKVVQIRYGYLDLFQFLSPLGTRERPIRTIKDEIRKAATKYPNARISVVAHSFGTYALMRAIRDPSIEINRVILCGAVLPDELDIERYFYATEDTRILNDCGVRDVWPVLAKCFTWGYGASGTFGFGKVAIEDRLFPFSHSEFFSQNFVSKFWVPFIRDGSIIPPDMGTCSPSGWLSVLGSGLVSGTIRILASLAFALGTLSSIYLLAEFWSQATR